MRRPYIYGCVICGTEVGSSIETVYTSPSFDPFLCPDEERWKYEFRVLRMGLDGTVEVTGIGIFDDPRGEFIAPPNCASRWDDPGYNRKDPRHILTVMRDTDKTGNRAFLFHDACYQLLGESTRPRSSLNLERLFEIFSSLPISNNLLAWGHDYGGIIKPDFETRYPWEDLEYEYNNDSLCPLVSSSFPGSLIIHEENLISSLSKKSGGFKTPDIFCKLPAELILMISELLGTEDYLNARSSSRAFWDAFYTSGFWFSRFQIGAERGWLFEMRQSSYSTADMQKIYRCSAKRRLNPYLWNRRRICDLILSIHHLLDLEWMGSSLQTPAKCEELLWRDQEALIQTFSSPRSFSIGPDIPWDTGCRVVEKIEFDLSRYLIHAIWFYFSSAGDKQYLSGMEIQVEHAGAQGQKIWLKAGYRSKAKRHYCVPAGSRIVGFGLAILVAGIKAIQVHTVRNCEEAVSDWFGDGDDCPKSLKTMVSGVSAFRASFDAFKMVSLGLAESQSSIQKSTSAPCAANALRRQALWFPEIPSPALSLNEDSFITADTYKCNFCPLFWTCFGGEKGERLSSLTGIDALIDYCIIGIQFGYDGEIEMGVNSSELGRLNSWDCYIDEGDKTQSFSIDGPAGERVTSVGIKVDHYLTPFVRVAGITINTNFARSNTFIREGREDEEYSEFLLVPEPGTTIIGFYAHQYSPYDRDFSCLGIISAVIEDPTPSSGD